MAAWELAQLNIARWAVDPDGPIAQTFMDQLDEINGLGERSDGFVWRMQDEAGDATGIETPFGDGFIANLTVWRDPAALRAFIYGQRHATSMKDRFTWFERPTEPTTVMWWIPAGHIPTLDEAAMRLAQLRSQGASAEAFGLRDEMPAPLGQS